MSPPGWDAEDDDTPEVPRALLSAAVAWYTATTTPSSVPRSELYERERALRLAIRAAYRAVHGRDL